MIVASSPWPTSPAAIDQRWSTGIRCKADARLEPNEGDGSSTAIRANSFARLLPGACLPPKAESPKREGISFSCRIAAAENRAVAPPVTCSAQIARSLRARWLLRRTSACSCDYGPLISCPGRGSLLQNPPGVANIPVVLVPLQLHQLGVALFRQIEIGGHGIRLFVNDLVQPAAAAIGFGDVVAFAVVATSRRDTRRRRDHISDSARGTRHRRRTENPCRAGRHNRSRCARADRCSPGCRGCCT